MKITTIKTGYTIVSPAVPDRSARRNPLAYTGLFQRRSKRIQVPVKCFYVQTENHSFLIDAGWSRQVVDHPLQHLGFGLNFASEPVMREEEAAVYQLKGLPIEGIYMTHLDCDHVSGIQDFPDIPVFASQEEILYSQKQKIRYGKLTQGKTFIPLSFRPDDKAPFGKSCDIFKDGSVIAYLTPTHSAGSILYKINQGDRYALITGDNGYNESSWKNDLLPGPLFNADHMHTCLH